MILNETSALPLAERIDLCRSLWTKFSSQKDLAPGEAELIDARLQAHADSPDDVVSLEEVKAKLDASYRQ